jgi:hypothetical protein
MSERVHSGHGMKFARRTSERVSTKFTIRARRGLAGTKRTARDADGRPTEPLAGAALADAPGTAFAGTCRRAAADVCQRRGRFGIPTLLDSTRASRTESRWYIYAIRDHLYMEQ